MKSAVALLLLSLLFFASLSRASSTEPTEDRQVRVMNVQGDVRLSRGAGDKISLNKSWEQALDGEPIEQGFALSTGEGRAEIEFESGSTVFLAPNSLLLFRELSSRDDRVVSRLALATGTATFALQPLERESFVLETPTDKLTVTPPEGFFARVDSYLDATGITPQESNGESMARRGLPKFHIAHGQTIYMNSGEVILAPELHSDAFAINFATLSLREPNMNSHLSNSSDSRSLDWDESVAERVQQKSALMAAALKASGLSAPVPGLAELYEHGNFFPCESYGTCWEPNESPSQQAPAQESNSQPADPASQSPGAATNTGFQTQTVKWLEHRDALCGLEWIPVSATAHNPDELKELLRRRDAAQLQLTRGNLYPNYWGCYQGYWIHRQGRFARVITPVHPVCKSKTCHPKPHPYPHFVKVGGRIGIVPRHPLDAKGKPPLNLKNGVVLLQNNSTKDPHPVALPASQRIEILKKLPTEIESELHPHSISVAPPQVRVHLVQDALPRPHQAAHQPQSHITFDLKSQKFMMSGNLPPGSKSETKSTSKSKEFPVGRITSNGKVSSFADGRHSSYAGSFTRAAGSSSYSASAFSNGSRGSTSNYSGGERGSTRGSASGYSGGERGSSGRNSGSSPSSSGSHSSGGGGGYSGGGSSGGGSSHTSSSGSSSSSSASSSSASSSSSSSSSGSSGGGRPH